MRTVNIHEAKTHLSRLVDQAANGEPFVIAKAGKPMVKVVPLGRLTQKAGAAHWVPGRASTSIPDDFDPMGQEEIIRMFEGEPD